MGISKLYLINNKNVSAHKGFIKKVSHRKKRLISSKLCVGSKGERGTYTCKNAETWAVWGRNRRRARV
jgi:hypothetical protein